MPHDILRRLPCPFIPRSPDNSLTAAHTSLGGRSRTAQESCCHHLDCFRRRRHRNAAGTNSFRCYNRVCTLADYLFCCPWTAIPCPRTAFPVYARLPFCQPRRQIIFSYPLYYHGPPLPSPNSCTGQLDRLSGLCTFHVLLDHFDLSSRLAAL